MMASYYDYSHAGSPTASGELYDPAAFTAAHKILPFGTQLLVSHGGASVQVAVNDRGPYADGLDIDLSGAAADAIGLTNLGVAPVEVEFCSCSLSVSGPSYDGPVRRVEIAGKEPPR
jgi:rare lipoprotein A